MAGLFEKHDRGRFETIGISLRDDEHSPMARRVRAAFEHFVVAGDRSDEEIAAADPRGSRVDVLQSGS